MSRRQMTNAEWNAAMREQLRMLEVAYQRSQSGRKWRRKTQPTPQSSEPAPVTPYLGPLFAEVPQ